MGENGMSLKESKAITIFLKFPLLKKCEDFMHKAGLLNRSKAIVTLIEKGLEKAKEPKKEGS